MTLAGRPWRDDSVRVRLSERELRSLDALASGLTEADPKLGRLLHRFGARGRFARFVATSVFLTISGALLVGLALITPVLALVVGSPICLVVGFAVGRIYDGPRAPGQRR